jgi:hypothetical protein
MREFLATSMKRNPAYYTSTPPFKLENEFTFQCFQPYFAEPIGNLYKELLDTITKIEKKQGVLITNMSGTGNTKLAYDLSLRGDIVRSLVVSSSNFLFHV